MGRVLGATTEHVLASCVPGMIVNRLRFADAFNERGAGDWELRYVDPERMMELAPAARRVGLRCWASGICRYRNNIGGCSPSRARLGRRPGGSQRLGPGAPSDDPRLHRQDRPGLARPSSMPPAAPLGSRIRLLPRRAARGEAVALAALVA